MAIPLPTINNTAIVPITATSDVIVEGLTKSFFGGAVSVKGIPENQSTILHRVIASTSGVSDVGNKAEAS